jgi:hypothetical protein
MPATKPYTTPQTIKKENLSNESIERTTKTKRKQENLDMYWQTGLFIFNST